VILYCDLEKAVGLLPLNNVAESVGKGAAWAGNDIHIYCIGLQNNNNTEFLKQANCSCQNLWTLSLADGLSFPFSRRQSKRKPFFIMMER